MGYDVMTAIAASAMVDMISFSVSPSSVYTVGISHEVAQLPMFSGFAFRLTLLIIFNIIMQFYVLRYAKKVKKISHIQLCKVLMIPNLESTFQKH